MDYAPGVFEHINQLARAALPMPALARYVAYRDAMMAEGEDTQVILAELSVFLLDLVDGRSGASLH